MLFLKLPNYYMHSNYFIAIAFIIKGAKKEV